MGWLDVREEDWDAPIDTPVIKPSGWTGEHRKLVCFKREARKVVMWGIHPAIQVIAYDRDLGANMGSINSYVLSQSMLPRLIHTEEGVPCLEPRLFPPVS